MNTDKMQKYFFDAKYGLPKDVNEAVTRLRINLPTHIVDYTPFAGLFVLIVALFVGQSAKFLFVNIFSVLAVVAAFILPQQYKLDRNITLACYAGAALFVIVLFAATKLFVPEAWAFALALVAAAVHAVFRPVQTIDKINDKLEHSN